MKKIKIFADSACDLDLDVLQELNVGIVPLTVNFGDELYEDRVTITTKDFYNKLKDFNGFPTTSQVTPAAFVEKFKKALDEGYHIISVSFSSKLSGTYQSSCIAKDMLESDDIDVFDTKCASVGCGLIVREAALMAREGRSREEILERMKYMSERMEHVFAVGHLDMLKKGGRISTAQAVFGTLLNVKPILQFDDGQIVPYDKVRGEKAIIKKLIETMKERGDIENQRVIGLNYSETDTLCMELRDEIVRTFGEKEFVISEIGASIGAHVGGGTVAIFFLRR